MEDILDILIQQQAEIQAADELRAKKLGKQLDSHTIALLMKGRNWLASYNGDDTVTVSMNISFTINERLLPESDTMPCAAVEQDYTP